MLDNYAVYEGKVPETDNRAEPIEDEFYIARQHGHSGMTIMSPRTFRTFAKKTEFRHYRYDPIEKVWKAKITSGPNPIGYYVQSRQGLPKEEWLARNGRPYPLRHVDFDKWANAGDLPVALIFGGEFSTAPICWNFKEFVRVSHVCIVGKRNALWYRVMREVLVSHKFLPGPHQLES